MLSISNSSSISSNCNRSSSIKLFFFLLLLIVTKNERGTVLSFVLPPTSTIRPTNYYSLKSSNDNGNNIIEYNDFDFEAGDNNDDDDDSTMMKGSTSTLQSRFEEVRKEERQKDAIILENWRKGNWNVRGFSLDRYTGNDDNKLIDDIDENNDDESTAVIDISQLSLVLSNNNDNYDDDDENRMLIVGRTDGSVCVIEIGTEYWTRFDSKLKVKGNKDAVTIESQLVRDTSRDSIDDNSLNDDDNVPFEIVHQLKTPEKKEITSILAIHDDDYCYDTTSSSSLLRIITGDIDGNIKIWNVKNNNDNNKSKQPPINLDVHSGNKIIALKSVSLTESTSNNNDDDDNNNDNNNLLVSISCDGTVALLDIMTNDLVYKCRIGGGTDSIENNDDVLIHCADVFEGCLFLGLSSGRVVTYKVDEMIQSASMGETACAIPNGNFLASNNGGITAIACGGNGRRLNNSNSNSIILVTGSANGKIKQWELLPQPKTKETTITKIEHWPKLDTQRMAKRAHLFGKGGHVENTSVTALAYQNNNNNKYSDTTHFVSAGMDGTIRVWNPTTGKELFLLDGFDINDASSTTTSLCLTHDTLITGGNMKQFVCFHDFNVDLNNVDKGFELEW